MFNGPTPEGLSPVAHSVPVLSYRALAWSHLRAYGGPLLAASGLWFLLTVGVVLPKAEEDFGRKRARVVALSAGAVMATAMFGLFLLGVRFNVRRYRLELDGDILTVGRTRFHLRYVEAIWFGRRATRFERAVDAAARLGIASHGGLGFPEVAARGTMVVLEKTGRATEFLDFAWAFEVAALIAFLKVLEGRGVRIGGEQAT